MKQESRKCQVVCPAGINKIRVLLLLEHALALAVESIDGMPDHMKSVSERDDMVAIFLHNMGPESRERILAQVERETGHAPDMTDWKTETRS